MSLDIFAPGGFADRLRAAGPKSAFARGGFADRLQMQGAAGAESAFDPGGFADRLHAQAFGEKDKRETERETRRRAARLLMMNLPPGR